MERVGQSGELKITETNENGEVTFETTGTSGDAEGEIYKITAVDKFGNKAVKILIR